jgi:hypothetical protein
MITLVITSCGRLDLLERTIKSFQKFNSYPIEKTIIVDDSGTEWVHRELKERYSDYELILKPHRGQLACIDAAYSRVNTPYIFHLEEDWEFIKGGFIEDSLKILKAMPLVLQVWIWNGNRHPVKDTRYQIKDIQFQVLGEINDWYGFGFNPGLRRLKDYYLVRPFGNFKRPEGAPLASTECMIGIKYHELGFYSVILPETYCNHIGVGRYGKQTIGGDSRK